MSPYLLGIAAATGVLFRDSAGCGVKFGCFVRCSSRIYAGICPRGASVGCGVDHGGVYRFPGVCEMNGLCGIISGVSFGSSVAFFMLGEWNVAMWTVAVAILGVLWQIYEELRAIRKVGAK